MKKQAPYLLIICTCLLVGSQNVAFAGAGTPFLKLLDEVVEWFIGSDIPASTRLRTGRVAEKGLDSQKEGAGESERSEQELPIEEP